MNGSNDDFIPLPFSVDGMGGVSQLSL
ncbi:hypothetical protein FRIGORI9N_280013 [Frigoribacterium sp. 9N]|nr:hypothetical protein FRIGORI9N_280013 [Frigoribacterium sp. 9N]